MSQPKKRSGVGLSADEVPEHSTVSQPSSSLSIISNSHPKKRPTLDHASPEFIEGQTIYAKIRSEIRARFLAEVEKEFRKTVTTKMKAEIRHGMVLDVQEENRKLLLRQKEKMVGEIRKEVRMRARIRREVRAVMREERGRELEGARREARYECEEKINELEERIRELEERD